MITICLVFLTGEVVVEYRLCGKVALRIVKCPVDPNASNGFVLVLDGPIVSVDCTVAMEFLLIPPFFPIIFC